MIKAVFAMETDEEGRFLEQPLVVVVVEDDESYMGPFGPIVTAKALDALNGREYQSINGNMPEGQAP